MLIDGWINKQNVIYSDNRISFSFRKEEHAVICYGLDKPGGHMVSEVDQSEKRKGRVIPLTWSIRSVKLIETGSGMVAPGG